MAKIWAQALLFGLVLSGCELSGCDTRTADDRNAAGAAVFDVSDALAVPRAGSVLPDSFVSRELVGTVAWFVVVLDVAETPADGVCVRGKRYKARLTPFTANGDVLPAQAVFTHSGAAELVYDSARNVVDILFPVEYTAAGLYVDDDDTPQPDAGPGLLGALAWIKNNAKDGANYAIVLDTNEPAVPTQVLNSAAIKGRIGVTITLAGVGGERTIQLSGTGSLFSISAARLVLDRNITLKGVAANAASLVDVRNSAAKLRMSDGAPKLRMFAGAKITGNGGGAISGHSGHNGGGVHVSSSSFVMSGGEISGNGGHSGGGVYVFGSTFAMSGGEISGNSSHSGGGVYANSSTFTMSGGAICDNTVHSDGAAGDRGGGGVVVHNSMFAMSGGVIAGNAVNDDGAGHGDSGGGGVDAFGGIFTMTGGEIYGNTANFGAGVYANDTFTKTGGVIYGYAAADAKSNKPASGGIDGCAVYVTGYPIRCRETTAGADVNLDSGKVGVAGGWEQ